MGGVEWVDGRFGEALELDGTSGYVEIELTPELIAIENDSFTEIGNSTGTTFADIVLNG